jgi:hypothetical protein
MTVKQELYNEWTTVSSKKKKLQIVTVPVDKTANSFTWKCLESDRNLTAPVCAGSMLTA